MAGTATTIVAALAILGVSSNPLDVEWDEPDGLGKFVLSVGAELFIGEISTCPTIAVVVDPQRVVLALLDAHPHGSADERRLACVVPADLPAESPRPENRPNPLS